MASALIGLLLSIPKIMPTSLTSSSATTSLAHSPRGKSSATARGQSPRPPLFSWLREPLLHFIVLGGLLFAIDHFLVGRADDPHTIVIGAEVDNEAITVFTQARGHKPNDEELSALHRVWLDNEILYREGLALQLDKGDPMMRERVIFKALSMIEANVKLPAISDKELRDWFEAHRDKYDDPQRYNFQEAVLAGENSESSVRAFVATLNSGKSGDTEAGLRVFKDRPLANLAQSYGAEFPKALDTTPAGQWQALKTRDGWRAIRLDSITPPKPAVFEALRNVIMQDWKDAVASQQRTDAVRALGEKYKVKYETAAK